MTQFHTRSRGLGFAAAAAALLSCHALAAQQPSVTPLPSVVAPASAMTTYGGSLAMLPGADVDGKLFIVIDEANIGLNRIGTQITALRFLREQKRPRATDGGAVMMSFRMGPAAAPATEIRPEFARNFSATIPPQTVFQGRVQFPPTAITAPAQPDWTLPSDSVVVPLSTPYLYTGGPLAIEIEGVAVSGSRPGAWFIDGVAEGLHGLVTEIGSGCGQSGRLTVSPSSLVAGSTVKFFGRGPINTSAALLLGRSMAPVDLGLVGVGGLGCNLVVRPFATFAVAYGSGATGASSTATASSFLRIPTNVSVMSAELSAQFVTLTAPLLEVGQAVTCRLADRLPTLGMSMVSKDIRNGVMPTAGKAVTNRAPTIAFDFAQ